MLSVTARHALRALVELTMLPKGEAILGRELAQRTAVPPNYLAKILWTLGSAGMIDATRGSGGGYRLRKQPESIRLVEVVDLFDKIRSKGGCLLADAHPCSDADPCSAHESWRGVKKAYTEFLENTSLADISKKPMPACIAPAGRTL